ncbi:MAG: hypothetical protein IMX00_07690 [Limnochordales bacterium]|nr:hypothetical protein [Limnochordales bacterium]
MIGASVQAILGYEEDVGLERLVGGQYGVQRGEVYGAEVVLLDEGIQLAEEALHKLLVRRTRRRLPHEHTVDELQPWLLG